MVDGSICVANGKSQMVIKLVVAGAAGRMGSAIINLASRDKELQVIYGLESLAEKNQKSPHCPIGPDTSQIQKADVVINFATAVGTMVGLRPIMTKYPKPWVIGTTGFDENQEATIREISKTIPIVKSSNMSMGVNVFFKVAQEIAKALPNYDVHIWEAHHEHKKDKPSGTALQAGKLIEQVSKRKVIYDEPKREGEIVGDHRIVFSSPTDKLELFHHAETRDIFALGALQAAKWIVNQKPGLYTMQDVLGLR